MVACVGLHSQEHSRETVATIGILGGRCGRVVIGRSGGGWLVNHISSFCVESTAEPVAWRSTIPFALPKVIGLQLYRPGPPGRACNGTARNAAVVRDTVACRFLLLTSGVHVFSPSGRPNRLSAGRAGGELASARVMGCAEML